MLCIDVVYWRTILTLDERLLTTKILKALEEAFPLDLSIEEVSKRSGAHRNTVAKYLAVLSAEGKVELRSLGKAKLYRLKKSIGS